MWEFLGFLGEVALAVLAVVLFFVGLFALRIAVRFIPNDDGMNYYDYEEMMGRFDPNE
jgi:hypothetical protein